jgi:hypothetical protein
MAATNKQYSYLRVTAIQIDIHDWLRQTPRSFETTVLDIPQMTSRPRGGSHDWVRQTPQSFEITILEYIIKHIIQTEF